MDSLVGLHISHLSSPPPLHVSLQTSKEDLLQADFEGALKFFRVQLPKRYRAAENARRLMEQACNIKVRKDPHMCVLLMCPLVVTLLFTYKKMAIHNIPWCCKYYNKESLL